MSDVKTPPAANGAAATNADVNITAPKEDHPDSAVVPKLRSKIQLLEQDLVNAKLKIKHLEDQISSHESDKRALNSIAARASELETQFSSLEHDLISSASEFEAKERENVEKMKIIEFERNLLLENLKENEEIMSEQLKEYKDRISEREAGDRERAVELSALEARLEAIERKKADETSELEARQRKLEDELTYLEARDRNIVDQLSELKAMKRKIMDKLSEQEAIERQKSDKISELEAINREKSDKISELEAREREKSDKISELETRLEATEREKSDKISELEARLEATEREKRIKLIH